MSDDDLHDLIALAMLDAQIEAATTGEHDAQEELDGLADLAADPHRAREVLGRIPSA